MTHIRLIHWNTTEAKEKATILESSGYEVDYKQFSPQTLKELKNDPPAAIVIDLSRLPSQGRDVAINMRYAKTTRNIPIIFVEGDPQKVNQIKALLSDAIHTDYNHIHTALKQAVANPPKVTVVPKSVFEPYKNTPLAKKLGIKPNTTLALINPSKDFTKTLGKLPRNVKILANAKEQSTLTIWFTKTQKDLESNITKTVAALAQNGKLWIAWPKKQADTPTKTDLTHATVRKAGLAYGLVDYKICSINQMWSALLFTKRKNKDPP